MLFVKNLGSTSANRASSATVANSLSTPSTTSSSTVVNLPSVVAHSVVVSEEPITQQMSNGNCFRTESIVTSPIFVEQTCHAKSNVPAAPSTLYRNSCHHASTQKTAPCCCSLSPRRTRLTKKGSVFKRVSQSALKLFNR